MHYVTSSKATYTQESSVITVLVWLAPHETAAVSCSVYTIQPYTMSLQAKPHTPESGVLTALVPHETAAVSACSMYTVQPCTTSLQAKPHTPESGVLTALAWLVPHETAAVSACSVYTIQPCTTSLQAKPHPHKKAVYLQRWHGWRHMKLLLSQHVLCTPYNHAPHHFKQSHIHTRKRCTYSTGMAGATCLSMFCVHRTTMHHVTSSKPTSTQ